MKRLVLSLSLLSLACAGCATSYQPSQGNSGGFSEVQWDDHTFQVSFHGNRSTTIERAQELTLLRSADLTLQNGFSYFVISDSKLRKESETTPMAQQAGRTESPSQPLNAAPTTRGRKNVPSMAEPVYIQSVVMYAEKPVVQDGTTIYNASIVCTTLGPRYNTQCGYYR